MHKEHKTRIMYFIGSLQLGGAERQLAELAVRLDKNLFDIEICCIAQGGPLIDYVQSHGIKVSIFQACLLKGKYNPFSYIHIVREMWRIFRHIRKQRPDIVHAFLYTAYVIGVLCARLAHIPVIIASRRSLGFFKESNFIKQPLENFVNLFTHHVLVNSRAVQEDVLRRERIDPDKIKLIYNGVDLERFQTKVEKNQILCELGIPHDRVIVGVVANLIHYKGHRELVEAARIIKQRVPSIAFIFVGRDGGIKKDLQNIILEYHLVDTIFFTNDRNDIPRLMQGFDIAALASHEEGFSNVILEAMATGLPMVATNVGGNPEAVVDGETGFIVPTRNPEALAQALLKLIENPILRKHMGEKGRQRVALHFSIQRLISDMQEFYLSLMEKKNAKK